MNEPLQLGKIYEVKCILFESHTSDLYGRNYSAYLPVMGETHKDNLAGDLKHIHVDNRFLSYQEIKDFNLSTKNLNVMEVGNEAYFIK